MLRLQIRNQPDSFIKLSFSTVTMGREESNSLVVDSPSVSDFHAEIVCENHHFFLNDLFSANGTFVSDERISSPREVFCWDIIRIGSVELEVVDPNQCRPGDWALLSQTSQLSKTFYVLGQCSVVGRETDCDITIESDMISRRHAQLSIEQEQLRVTDLDSSNGTFLNGERITDALASPGDELRFDQLTFLIKGPYRADESIDDSDGAHTVLRDMSANVDPEATQISLAQQGDNDSAENALDVTPSFDDAIKSVPELDAVPPIAPNNELAEEANSQRFIQSSQYQQPGPEPVKESAAEERSADSQEEQTCFLPPTPDPDETQFLQLPQDANSEAIAPKAFLVEKADISASQRLELVDSHYSLGRSPDNTVVLADASVSKHHAKLYNSAGKWMIEDLGARNGVFLNDAQVTTAEVSHGDSVSLGRVEFVFEIETPELEPNEDLATVFYQQTSDDVDATAPVPRNKSPGSAPFPLWLSLLLIFLGVSLAAVALYLWRSGQSLSVLLEKVVNLLS